MVLPIGSYGETAVHFSEVVRRTGEAVLPVLTVKFQYDKNHREKRRFLLPNREKGDHGHG